MSKTRPMEDFELDDPLPPPIYVRPAADMPEDFRRLVDRLPRHRPTRRIAIALLGKHSIPVEDIAPMAQSLADPAKQGWRESLVAVWAAARTAGAADRRAAAGWLSHVLEFWPSLDGWPRLKRSYLRTLIGLYAILFLAVGFTPGVAVGSLFAALPLCLVAYPFSAWLDRSRLNRVRAEAAHGLGLLAQPSSAATLAGGMLDGDERVRTNCREALLRVLPTVTDDQYGRLPFDTTPRLCALLNRTDETLILLTLRALASVGDSRALDYIIRFQRRPESMWADRRIPIEGQRTFEILMGRRKRELDAASLLRPTGNPEQPSQALLRPYVQAGDHPAENLLRATSDD